MHRRKGDRPTIRLLNEAECVSRTAIQIGRDAGCRVSLGGRDALRLAHNTCPASCAIARAAAVGDAARRVSTLGRCRCDIRDPFVAAGNRSIG